MAPSQQSSPVKSSDDSPAPSRPGTVAPPANRSARPATAPANADNFPAWFDLADMARLERFALAYRRGSRSTGEFKSAKRGGHLEFLDHRPYSLGDDLKFLDWNVFGRLDQLHIKTHAREMTFTVTVVVDSSPSMNFPLAPGSMAAKDGLFRRTTTEIRAPRTKFEAALYAASVVSYLAMTAGPKRPGGNRVRLVVGETEGGKPRMLPPRAGSPGFLALMRDLSQISRPDGGEFPPILDRLAGSPQSLDGLLVVITDGYQSAALQTALKRLAARPSLELLVIHLLSPEELAPTLEGTTELVDAETGAEVGLAMEPRVRQAYLEALGRFIDKWHEFCAHHSIFFVQLSADAALLEHLLTGLHHAGVIV